MPFLDFLFSPQAHKFRDGYNINHDTIMNVSPAARSKLIFYFIAEQVPVKLEQQDRAAYQHEKLFSIAIPRTIWMFSALFMPLALGVYKKQVTLKQPLGLSLSLMAGGLLAPFAVAVHSRVYEARFVDSNKVIDQLSKKYNFGVYDFSVAKKQSHILQLMYTMDNPYLTLHS